MTAYLTGNPDAGIPGLRLPNTSITPNCGCDTINLVCEAGAGPGGAYTTPRGDDAPWFDSGVPDSEDFAGFFITEVEGFDSTVKRDFSDGAIAGGSLGPMRLAGRCLTVTGWLRARTCCGAEYGLRWLQEALMGNNSCADCGYGDAYMIRCCPPEGDSCYTSEVAVTETVNGPNVWFSITDSGGGIYVIEIDDANQANLISDPAGLLNNTDGPIPTCYGAGRSFRFVLADANGAIFTFFIPFEAIVSFVTANSGAGALATFVVDTNTVGSCDDVVRQIQNFQADVNEYFLSHDSGDLVPSTSPTQVRCFETLPGYNPNDYARVLHRVGLTDGPKVTDRAGTCCDDCGFVNLQVQFTICSELPHIFSDIEWCIEDKRFNLEECYCLDLRKLCKVCSTQDATKIVEVEVARPPCGIDVLHDGSWCPVGWTTEDLGCIPTDCFLDINEVVPYDPEDNTDCTSASVTDNDPCVIGLYGDLTWAPLNFDIGDRGFPPEFCDLAILFGGTCDDDNPDNCLIRLIYNEGDGSMTWEPIGWSGTLPASPECNCIEIAEICVIGDEGGCPEEASQCPINILCESNYQPNECLSRQGAASFFYRYNGSPAFVPPAVPTFSDVGINSPFYLEIEWANAQGILVGFGDGTFGPGNSISRQAMATAFYRDAGSPFYIPPVVPTYPDVPTTNPFYLEIEWATDEHIIFGYDDGTFRPGECATRRAAALMFYRYADTQPTFTDVPCSSVAYTDIEWTRAQGIFFGFNDSTFRPANDVSRRTAAISLYRAAGSPIFVPPGVPTFLDVPLTDPGYKEIEWAFANSYLLGFSGPTFQPDTDLARQAAMAMLYRFNGSPPFVPPGVPTFTDVPVIHPFYLEIEWAAANGIAVGFPDGSFQPGNPTSRQAMAQWYYRNAGSPAYVPGCYVPSTPPHFADVPETDPNYQQIQWLADEGITFGFSDQRTWEPIGWDHDPEGLFPPENCNVYVALVNGEEPNLGPIRQEVEVAFDEFVPDCGVFPIPPPAPLVFDTICYCEPWEQTRECCTFTNPADWNEATTYVEINTGSEEMRNLKIEAYRNPFGEKVPCPCDPEDDFWDCRDPCATILVPQLPKQSKLVIDSRTRNAVLVLSSGRSVNALRYIYSGDGKPFEWFDIGQCSTFCIVVQADCRQTAADATVSVGAVGRFVNSGG